MFALSIILCIAIGVAMSFQSPTNAGLGLSVGAMQASLTSFAGGFVVLLVLSLIIGDGSLIAGFHQPLWQLLGGVYGAAVVFSLALSTPRLGVSLAIAILMLGQIVGAMFVDGLGLFHAQAIPVSPLRIGGCLLVAAGIAAVCAGGMKSGGGLASEVPGQIVGCGALSFAAGVGSACQLPTNAALSHATGMLEAATLSFAGGVIVLLVLTLVFNKGRFNSYRGVKPWQCTGGLYGAYGVAANIVASPVLGVGLAMAVTMFAQIIGAMVVDSLGLLRMRKTAVNRWRVVGACLLLAGAACVAAAKALA